jgi:DNA-binding transcriptional regulator YiaG
MTPSELKEARRKLGLSSVQLATLLGVHPQSVRRMESGSRVIQPTTERLIRAYVDGYRPHN